MYELERQAQNDPFLMDVIKGMESGNENHQPNLDAIDRLIQQRVQQDKRRVIPIYKYWPAAACLLIALGIGGWWLTHQNAKSLVAVNIHQVEPARKVREPLTVVKPTTPATKPAAIAKSHTAEIKEPEPPATAEITLPSPAIGNEMKTDTIANKIAYNRPVEIKNRDNILREVIVTGYGTQKLADTAALNKAGRIANAPVPRTITGKVVDKKNGVLLPGVPIIINGTDQGIKTNVDGSFAAVMRAKHATIAVNKEGYEPQQIKIDNQDNLKIELVPDNKALSKKITKSRNVQKGDINSGMTTGSTVASEVQDTAKACNENIAFKNKFLSNISIAEKYTLTQVDAKAQTIKVEDFLNALKFISKYASVSFGKVQQYQIGYPTLNDFKTDKDNWLKWYNANKCNNLK
jgi:hypothetical protein